MSSLEAKKITPATGTTVTLGAAGDTVDVAATALKTNTIKDAGGNTLFTSNGSGTLSSINSAFAGGMVFISSQTADGAASLSFTSDIDSTYNEYIFVLTSITTVTDNVQLYCSVSSDGGSTYGALTKTMTYFSTYHDPDDDAGALNYSTTWDRSANTTDAIVLMNGCSSTATRGVVSIFHLCAPSSTTYVKQYYARGHAYHATSNATQDVFPAGYINTTLAIDAIKFTVSSGNFSGTIAMYGTGKP